MTKIQFATASLVLKIHFLGAFPPGILSILSPNIRRTTQFMAEATFMQHIYMLSFQKTRVRKPPWQLIIVSISDSLVVIHQQFVRSLLLATLAKKNTLGEVDKINLTTRFAAGQYDFHLWANDSKIGGNETHAVGVPHTWNSESQKPY